MTRSGRNALLLLAVLVSGTALGQEPAAPAAEPSAAPEAASPAEPPAGPAAAVAPAAERPAAAAAAKPAPDEPKAAASPAPRREPAPPAVEEPLQVVATEFYTALLHRDVERLLGLSRLPFYFEGNPASTPDEARRRWGVSLRGEMLDRIAIDGLEVLTADEMLQKYGKAPEKLSGWPLRGAMVSVANLGGHATVVLWRKNGTSWQALAIHD